MLYWTSGANAMDVLYEERVWALKAKQLNGELPVL
jgi:hypothetical protein